MYVCPSSFLSAAVLPVVAPGVGSWAAVGKGAAPKSTVVHLTRPMKACTPAVTFSVWAFFNYLYQSSRSVACAACVVGLEVGASTLCCSLTAFSCRWVRIGERERVNSSTSTAAVAAELCVAHCLTQQQQQQQEQC